MRKLTALARLGAYIHKYRTRLIIGAICVTLSNLASSISPLILKHAIDSLKQTTSTQHLVLYCLLILLFALLEALFLFLMRKIMIGASRYIEYDLRNDLFAHLLGLSRRYYQDHKTGDIMSRATNDMNAVRMLLGPGIMYSLNTVLRLTIVLAIMFRINVPLTCFVLLIIPVVSLTLRYFGKLIHDRFEKIQETFSLISARVQENLAGVRVVKAYVQEASEIDQFDKLNRDYIRRNLMLIRIWGLLYPLLGAALGLSGAFMLWFGGREVMNGHMTLGDFVAFNAYLGMLSWPMIALGWVINIVERGTASMGRINQIFETQPEIIDRRQINGLFSGKSFPAMQTFATTPAGEELRNAEAIEGSNLRGEIEFRALNFSQNGVPILKEINLHIPAGATYAIVGETGSGKTSLVNLLPRMFDFAEGEILIDNRSIKDYPVAVLRAAIGYVPQETFLFSQTIRENILFGVDDAPEAALLEAATQAQILAEVEQFPAGFETLVGERGITLSGGQQQRTAIARALVRNPRILILDDALSSVDTVTEERILQALKTLMQGRTSLLISHRVSTVRFADQIIVLRDGRIVERGTHNELLEQKGYYANLYQKQLLEEELSEAG
jgi:ATP-binding cassette subfamily B multidrug efflux pump